MTLPWYPRDMGKYARDTAHLSMLEDGAYNNLLDHYYANGGLPCVFSNASSNAQLMPDHSRLHRICKASTHDEKQAAHMVLSEFFVLNKDGFYINEKCEQVIEEQEQKHERRVRAGRENRAKAMLKQCSSNATQKETKTKKEEDTNVSSPPISPVEVGMLFENFWNAYPGRGKDGATGAAYKGPKTVARKSFSKIYQETKEPERAGLIENLTAACGRYAEHLDRSGYNSKHASTWLNQRGWEDDYASTGTSAPPKRTGNTGYSLQAAHDQAMADTTRRPEGREQRLKNLGLHDDPDDVSGS